MGVAKATAGDLVILGGGEPTFRPPKSIGSLATPDPERFFHYSRIFFDSRRYTNNGPANRLLEQRLAEWHGVSRCVTFSSAFWGISLALRHLALPGRSEVVTPSLTYRRMGEIIASAGLVPRYCDVDPSTLAQSYEATKACVNDETGLILGAHPTVNCCDAEGLELLAAETGTPLLFDSVESAFETSKGRRVGTFGRAEAFSIHATKLINGFEGGYVVTDDEELADRLRFMRGFGIVEEEEVSCFGINAKLNEVHAAMALASLDGLPGLVERNRSRYLAYRDALQELEGIELRLFDEGEQTSFKNIVVRLTDSWPLSRDYTLAVLQAEGALARPYYSPALHTLETGFETRCGDLPVTEIVSRQHMLLPCGEQMGADDITRLAALLGLIHRHGEEIGDALDKRQGVTVNTGYQPVNAESASRSAATA
ncbi:MAG TPA: aminotransferase class I/II-fold pyridoxal phosphate-dependent enzyme [Acidimicrobiales bacterium]|nr:aminotransferase class I/II-fold pyridoxal phosphate-dependent enzyme [Acidimicrobiales bacterium]